MQKFNKVEDKMAAPRTEHRFTSEKLQTSHPVPNYGRQTLCEFVVHRREATKKMENVKYVSFFQKFTFEHGSLCASALR